MDSFLLRKTKQNSIPIWLSIWRGIRADCRLTMSVYSCFSCCVASLTSIGARSCIGIWSRRICSSAKSANSNWLISGWPAPSRCRRTRFPAKSSPCGTGRPKSYSAQRNTLRLWICGASAASSSSFWRAVQPSPASKTLPINWNESSRYFSSYNCGKWCV